MNWRRLSLLLTCLLGIVLPTVTATNQTGDPAENLTDTIYENAVATAAAPSSYQQAATLFQAIGASIAFIGGGLLLFLLFAAGIAGYRRRDRFWAVYFLTLFAVLALLIALPSLWIFV